MKQIKPIICKLTASDRTARGSTWREIVHTSVSAVEERDDGYVLTIRADSSSFEEIRGLVKAERECCQWMTLELHAGSPSTLTIAAASAEGKIAIKNMLAISEPI